MTSASMVRQTGSDLAQAVAGGEWALAERTLEYLAGAWSRAGGEDVATGGILAVLDGAHTELVIEHDLEQRPGPDRLAWMIAGARLVMAQSHAEPVHLEGDTLTRVLHVLDRDGGFVATGEVARLAGRDNAVVARHLPDMRRDGLVETRSAGRSRLNRITAEGRARLSTLRPVDDPEPVAADAGGEREIVPDIPPRAAVERMVTLERDREVAPTPVRVSDVLNEPELWVNHVEKVRSLELAAD